MKQTKKDYRVPEYLPAREIARRIVEPKIVDDTYARNIQRNIEKHNRQNARIEAERAKELQRQVMERKFFKKNHDKFQEKVVTPLNHCASSMMHSEAWNEMRKNNSPNTTGNKEGIAHNKKMREAIGTFKMPHSPLNLGHDKAGFPGNNWKKTLEPVKGKAKRQAKRANIERVAEKYDITKSQTRRGLRKMRRAGEDYIPQDYLDKIKGSPANKGHEIKKDSLSKDEAWAKWEKGYLDRTHKFKGTKFEKPITREENIKEMESERSEFMYDPKIGQIRLRKTDDAESPLNKEGKKDACYHKVKSRVKVWPSAYASGQLVQCRKRGASNWGVGKKK